ncbi:spc97 / spc98 family domain-containing protein [Purpureocillium lilacinum]|uniref:Spc97 / spc98 family domain-containing protein n=2 Tax=Purpureocillium lilacinum TaxID=33203 RepID=A0A179HG93_PURLI|nr:spc97 / spc98 family domain-containing protein [Purpureocillium lilacinum]KAK4083454.1 hypothetical protein Purlil1_10691 [Purpureocillium lilacinum]OAQ79559.1 spc97 / spc98 family domain-containing protein [Purpureocillium lilacinum]OAQ89044.1 spc97 / spc98 family domain-containing protein [Purpureocillium lilacinum]PWI73496.1 hypothetical protein PCL_08772 [Purpureocillium lilacinum]GJN84372.1 hypothetical protein PLIIFM63780_007928 [Purpureocillium lilacinum]
MAEVVGVVGTAVQLGALCLSIAGGIQSIRKSTQTLQNYNKELEEVGELSRRISENPLLQTPEIERYTASLLALIQRTGLAAILSKQRLMRAFFLLHKQQELDNTFTALERQKANLSLTIDDITLRTVHQIHLNVSRLNGNPETEDDTAMSSTRTEIIQSETGRDRLLEQSAPLEAGENTAVMPYSTSSDARGEGRRLSLQHMDTSSSPQGLAVSRQGATTSNFFRSYAGPNVDQRNGAQVQGAATILPHLRDSTQHRQATKEGPGEQRNGGTFLLEGSLAGPIDLAVLAGQHVNASATARPNTNANSGTNSKREEAARETVQNNGPKICFVTPQ